MELNQIQEMIGQREKADLDEEPVASTDPVERMIVGVRNLGPQQIQSWKS